LDTPVSVMSNIWPTLFKITTIAISITLVYFVVVVAQVYLEMKTTKPSDLSDLPVFSEVWWIPVISAVLLSAVRSRIKELIRPTFLNFGKDKDDL